MSSEKRIAASRANGALSRGPKTPEGKARSSRNATRHGLLSKIVVLQDEPDEAFHRICREYAHRFGPLDAVEVGMVDEMVATLWRLRRVWAIENRYFDTAMAAQSGPSATDRLMSAFSDLAATNRLNLLHRYETRLHTMFQRAFKNLLTLRKQSPFPGEFAPVPNEPKKSRISNKSAATGPKSNLDLTPIEPVLDTTQQGF